MLLLLLRCHFWTIRSLADLGYLAFTFQYCYFSPIEKLTDAVSVQYFYQFGMPLWNTFKFFSDTIVIFMTHNRYSVVKKIANYTPGKMFSQSLKFNFFLVSSAAIEK